MKLPTIQAKYILVLLPPTIEPPFPVKLGLRTATGDSPLRGELMLESCSSIADGIAQAEAVFERLGTSKTDDFMLIYPMFQGKDEAEDTQIINIAWEVKALADEHNWQFARAIPI